MVYHDNINKGHSSAMTEGCKPLSEYVWMIDKVRTYEKVERLEHAIDRALREMPEDFEIKRYLEANREGVKKMLLTEYDEVKTMRQFKEEGRAEGRAETKEEDARIIAETFNIPIENVNAALREKSTLYNAQ